MSDDDATPRARGAKQRDGSRTASTADGPNAAARTSGQTPSPEPRAPFNDPLPAESGERSPSERPREFDPQTGDDR